MASLGTRRGSKIQLGVETTAGTEVDATLIWRGPFADFEDEGVPVFIEEDVGMFAKPDRTMIPFTGGTLSMPDQVATFEGMVYILQAGIDHVGTQGTWSFPTSVGLSPKTYTLETGDDYNAAVGAYGFVEEFRIFGNVKDGLKMSAKWRVRVADYTGSFTALGGGNLADWEAILFQTAVLSIDTVGSLGTTPQTGTLIEMDFKCTTGLQAYWSGDGALYFYATKFVGLDAVMDITFEHDAFAEGARTAMKAETAKDLRLKFTNLAAKVFQIDLHGKFSKIASIDERDGNNILKGTFEAKWDIDEASGISDNDFGAITLTLAA